MSTSLRILSRSLRSTRRAIHPGTSTIARSFHQSPLAKLPYKDSQDRESLRPSATENTKTGRDDDVAGADPDAAFNPNKTRPEEAEAASSGTLEGSGANQPLSKPRGDEKSGNDRGSGVEVGKGGKSQGHSAQKAGNPKNK